MPDIHDIVIVLIVLALFTSGIVVAWMRHATEARILNETYGTDYTAWDMLFAGDIITKVVEGERRRLDVNLVTESDA